MSNPRRVEFLEVGKLGLKENDVCTTPKLFFFGENC